MFLHRILWSAASFMISVADVVLPGGFVIAQQATIEVKNPMPPPAWAVLQRELLRANVDACRKFYRRYFDERGYLLCVPRWGADDGPDDAIENVADWPLLHALGGADDILTMYKHVWEGHLRQYTEARTTEVPFAREGMYYKEFPVMMDWMHNGEGLRVFNLQGLSDPDDSLLKLRALRYAGFYMNQDPQAPNYDPEHRIIRSMFNGSRGPLMRNTTALDWAGDPIEVEGRFRPLHGERNYEEMLAHFKDYTDTVGDHPQNMSATTLALNAFMLTAAELYRDWLLEYVDAWLERTRRNNDIVPTKIGLDGSIGGPEEKWWGGTYGWGFSVEVPQTGDLAHRNRVNGGIVGFGNAYLLTGNQEYVEAWSSMLDTVNASSREIDGRMMYPRMHNEQGWYAWHTAPWSVGALQCWFWTCDDRDRQRVFGDPWVRYLQGTAPEFPVQAMQQDFGRIRSRVAGIRSDPTTPDTRLSDDPMMFNPASVQSLNKLMQGGLDPGRNGGPVHCRIRYFDPIRRRAGVPDDVAALVDRMDAESVSVTLVNISQTDAREVIVQCGAYGEHQCHSVTIDEHTIDVNDSSFRVILSPGSGRRLVIRTTRYVNPPRLAFPWDRG